MGRSFRSQLAGQVGEHLVVAELGRRGIIATTLAGNVPDIDILAYANGASCHIQVKSWTSGDVSLNASRYLRIEVESGCQRVLGLHEDSDQSLVYVFVRLGERAGLDRFFLMRQIDLQNIIRVGYISWLAPHGGIRPRNADTTHFALRMTELEAYEDNWQVIGAALESRNHK